MLLNGLILLEEKLLEDLVIADTALNKTLPWKQSYHWRLFSSGKSEEGERL